MVCKQLHLQPLIGRAISCRALLGKMFQAVFLISSLLDFEIGPSFLCQLLTFAGHFQQQSVYQPGKRGIFLDWENKGIVRKTFKMPLKSWKAVNDVLSCHSTV